MSISKKLATRFSALSEQERKKLIKMAWSDKVSMQEIEKTYGLSANQVEKFMLSALTQKEYIRWQKRLKRRFNQKTKKAALLNLNQEVKIFD